MTNYVQNVIQQHQKAVVGICFGHQILARALGAKVGRNTEGWEISVNNINLTDTGRELFGKDTLVCGCLFYRIYLTDMRFQSLHQMHRDIVCELPKDCINLGHSPVCGIQGFYRPKRILTVQAHPEFNDFIVSKIMEVRHEQKIFDDDLFTDGMSRAGLAHDGAVVGAAIIRFLLEM